MSSFLQKQCQDFIEFKRFPSSEEASFIAMHLLFNSFNNYEEFFQRASSASSVDANEKIMKISLENASWKRQ